VKVWLVTIGEELPHIQGIRKARTAMLADQLLGRGHDVLLWASAFDHFKKEWYFSEDTLLSINDRYRILALKGMGYRRNISPARFADHRLIARKFRLGAADMPPPDVVVAATPSYDLAYEAVRFGRKRGIPVLVDIRDQWPDIFLDHVPVPLHRLARLLIFREFYLFREAVRQAEGLIAMMDSLLLWGLQAAGRPRRDTDRVFYLGYRRSDGHEETSERIASLLVRLEGTFVVTFIGTFSHYHNPIILTECARRLAGRPIRFVLAGDGEFAGEILERARGRDNIYLPGFLNQDEIQILLRHSHVGVCPTPQKADFFPNKAFLYLSAGLPIIAAFGGDLKDFIEKHQVGFHYLPNDAEALTGLILRLSESRDLYDRMCGNVGVVFDRFLDGDVIYRDYCDHIESLVKRVS
jgi:glycosyltransferase involved in cell wall biosynthesis